MCGVVCVDIYIVYESDFEMQLKWFKLSASLWFQVIFTTSQDAQNSTKKMAFEVEKERCKFLNVSHVKSSKCKSKVGEPSPTRDWPPRVSGGDPTGLVSEHGLGGSKRLPLRVSQSVCVNTCLRKI
jgi:hypothetical protein